MKKRQVILFGQRPAVLARVRQLHEDGRTKAEIARETGFGLDTIRRLLREAGVPAPTRPSRPAAAPRKAYVFDRMCPTCESPVDVLGGLVEPHKAFFGRIGRGQVNGHLIPVAEDCPASGQHYKTLLKAKEAEACAV